MPTGDYAVHKTIEEGYQETIHQLRYENAQLRAALENLINHLPESEIELAREEWGNTNTRLILEYREEARQALAATKDERS